MFSCAAKSLNCIFSLSMTFVFGAYLDNMLCNAAVCVYQRIILFMSMMELTKKRNYYMIACAHPEGLHMCMLAAMFD